jgi:hypothetical protein
VALAVLVLGTWPAARLSAQPATVSTAGDAVHVRAPEFSFIKGEPLVRLKDGRSVRVDIELAVLPKPGAPPAAQSRQTFILSYDLWEERFAVTLPGVPSQSISHLTSTGAEAWCLERLTVPLGALGQLGSNPPFWIRLQSRIHDADGRPDAKDSGAFTLRGLIDALSRRRPAEDLMHSIEAGPFRLRE